MRSPSNADGLTIACSKLAERQTTHSGRSRRTRQIGNRSAARTERNRNCVDNDGTNGAAVGSDAEVTERITVTSTADEPKTIYWHRDLPPIDAERLADHVLEANSARVPGTIAHRDELWDRCYEQLMAETKRRFGQEMKRLGGDCVHVLTESIVPRHDEIAGEAWLHGQFTYTLYRAHQKERSGTSRQ
jgi:hypothetical protein